MDTAIYHKGVRNSDPFISVFSEILWTKHQRESEILSLYCYVSVLFNIIFKDYLGVKVSDLLISESH